MKLRNSLPFSSSTTLFGARAEGMPSGLVDYHESMANFALSERGNRLEEQASDLRKKLEDGKVERDELRGRRNSGNR